MKLKKYLVGYSISGHMLIEASNPQAAAASANGAVTAARAALDGFDGESEYCCPDGDVIDVTNRPTTPPAGGES